MWLRADLISPLVFMILGKPFIKIEYYAFQRVEWELKMEGIDFIILKYEIF